MQRNVMGRAAALRGVAGAHLIRGCGVVFGFGECVLVGSSDTTSGRWQIPEERKNTHLTHSY